MTDFGEKNNFINEKKVWEILVDLTQVQYFINITVYYTVIMKRFITQVLRQYSCQLVQTTRFFAHSVKDIVNTQKIKLVLQGLKHLHDNQMIHMDIKPPNVLIGLDSLYKIADFGLVLDISKVSLIWSLIKNILFTSNPYAEEAMRQIHLRRN